MKTLGYLTLALVIALITIFALTPPAQADLWTLWKNGQLEEKEGDAAYRVPAQGLDVRVYEWTPVGNPEVVCVMAFGQTNPVGLQCFAKSR